MDPSKSRLSLRRIKRSAATSCLSDNIENQSKMLRPAEDEHDSPDFFEASQNARQLPTKLIQDPAILTVREMYTQFLVESNEQEKVDQNKMFFLFEIWGLTCDKTTANTTTLDSQDRATLNFMKDFFLGDLDTSSSKILTSFLKNKPEKTVGKFIVGIVIFEFCLKTSAKVLYQFYNEAATLEKGRVKYITSIVSFIVQKAVLHDVNGELDLSIIPQSIVNLMDINPIYDKSVFSKLQKLNNFLTEFIREDLIESEAKCFGKDLKYEDVTKIWNNIASIATFQRTLEQKGNITDLIISQDLENHITTVPFFSATENSETYPVHLHQSIVGMYTTNAIPQEHTVVRASKSSVDLLRQLLYRSNIPQNWNPAISMEIYEMTKVLGVCDPWKFLFQEKSPVSLWENEAHRHIILLITLKCQRIDIISEIRNQVINFLQDNKNRKKIMRQLSLHEVLFLFAQVNLTQTQWEQYVMLIHWSFGSCNLKIHDEKHLPFHSQVATKFQLVKHLLKLEEMDSETLQQLFTHNYYPRKDLYKAVKASNKMR